MGPNAKLQSHQTFFYTNSVPQVEKLNSGLWSKLESYVISEVNDLDNRRIAVFTGPMLREDDPQYLMDADFRIPLYFFKIVVFPYNGALYSTGFVMSQKQKIAELGLISPVREAYEKAAISPAAPFSDYKHREVFQVNLDLIEDYTGLTFSWDSVQRVPIAQGEHKLRRIAENQERPSKARMEKAEFGRLQVNEYDLTRPFSFYVKCFDKPSLFAGKMHALLFRKWQNRVKGRDWYDLEWYIRKGIPLDLHHFKLRAKDTGHWDKDAMTAEDVLGLLKEKFKTVNFESVKEDVLPFIKDDTALNIWGEQYFNGLIEKMKFQ